MRKLRAAMVCCAVVLGVLAFATAPADESWAESFRRVQVPGDVARNDVTDLVDAGVVRTDGFSDLRVSLGGEFKEGVPSVGRVGVLLIPNEEAFLYLLRSEERIVFPLEATVDLAGNSDAVFVSGQHEFKIAFPEYRVFLYNETTSGAVVSVFVYRSR